jgi:hypothetical protein
MQKAIVVDYNGQYDGWMVYIKINIDLKNCILEQYTVTITSEQLEDLTTAIDMAIKFKRDNGITDWPIIVLYQKSDAIRNVQFTEEQYMIINDQTDIIEAILRFQ